MPARARDGTCLAKLVAMAIPLCQAAQRQCPRKGPGRLPKFEEWTIAVVIDEANKAREEGKEKVILFNWSGHGLMDLTGYDSYFQGKLSDYALPEGELVKSLEPLKDLPKPSLAKSGKW